MSTPLITGKPDAAQLTNPATARIWKAAQEFEAMVLGQLVGPMFATVDTSKGAFGGGAAEEATQQRLRRWDAMIKLRLHIGAGRHAAPLHFRHQEPEAGDLALDIGLIVAQRQRYRGVITNGA